MENIFDHYLHSKSAQARKTAGVGRPLRGIASLFLDFLVTFLSRKKLQEIKCRYQFEELSWHGLWHFFFTDVYTTIWTAKT